MKKHTLIAFAIFFGFSLQACEKIGSSSSWIKQIDKDQFSDKTSLVFVLKQTGKSAADDMLGLACTKEKIIDFQWMVSAKAPLMGESLPISISVRIDDGSTSEEIWQWSSVYPKISPNNHASVLDKLIGKRKLALRENQTGSSAVFDISGFDNVYSEVKAFCKK